MPTPPADAARFGDLAPSTWPGERLGLPRRGPRSVGRLGRRVAALAVDWALAVVVSMVFFAYDGIATLAVFVVMQILSVPTIGGSIGHLVAGLRVVPLAGGWIGLWRPAVRALLLAIVLPALVWDSDQRGFHDKVAGTVLVRA